MTDDTVVTTLNQELPPVIRIFGVLRTTKHFNAKAEAGVFRVLEGIIFIWCFLRVRILEANLSRTLVKGPQC